MEGVEPGLAGRFGVRLAPAPYVAVRNSLVTATQWDGEHWCLRERFSGLDLIAGTELRPGP